jgi:hypothetical protein
MKISDDILAAIQVLYNVDINTLAIVQEENTITFSGVLKGKTIKFVVTRYIPSMYTQAINGVPIKFEATLYVEDQQAFGKEEITTTLINQVFHKLQDTIKREKQFDRQDAFNFLVENSQIYGINLK